MIPAISKKLFRQFRKKYRHFFVSHLLNKFNILSIFFCPKFAVRKNQEIRFSKTSMKCFVFTILRFVQSTIATPWGKTSHFHEMYHLDFEDKLMKKWDDTFHDTFVSSACFSWKITHFPQWCDILCIKRKLQRFSTLGQIKTKKKHDFVNIRSIPHKLIAPRFF